MYRVIYLLGGMLLGALVGIAAAHYDHGKDWSQVLVVYQGTVVANPDALTPAELADAQIIRRDLRYIAFGCPGENGAVVSASLRLDCQEARMIGADR